MSEFVPIGKVLDASYVTVLSQNFLDDLQFVPLVDTEIHVTSHRLPICVHRSGPVHRSRTSVVALVEGAHLARPLLAEGGRWFGGYRPIALRCAPFRLRLEPTGNPYEDLEIWERAVLPAESGVEGAIPIRNHEGKLAEELGSAFNGLRHVQTEHNKLVAALDQIILANLLASIGEGTPTQLTPHLSTLSDAKFHALTNRALEAMARNTYAGIELATAMIFSQIHLVEGLRPAFADRLSLKHLQSDVSSLDTMATTLENLGAWLDESELFSLDHLVGHDQMPDPLPSR